MAEEIVTTYCPYCWKKVGEHGEVCSACGERLATYHLALHHPFRETRTVAIDILGALKSEKTLMEVAHPSPPVSRLARRLPQQSETGECGRSPSLAAVGEVKGETP